MLEIWAYGLSMSAAYTQVFMVHTENNFFFNLKEIKHQ